MIYQVRTVNKIKKSCFLLIVTTLLQTQIYYDIAFEMIEKMQEGENVIDTDDNQSETEDFVVIGHSLNNQTLKACAVR